MNVAGATRTTSYLRIWIALLALTAGMLVVDGLDLPRLILVLVLVSAMLVKGGLIAAYFMHLRHEGVFLVLTLVIGLLFFGGFLYALIAPDGLRILEMLKP